MTRVGIEYVTWCVSEDVKYSEMLQIKYTEKESNNKHITGSSDVLYV